MTQSRITKCLTTTALATLLTLPAFAGPGKAGQGERHRFEARVIAQFLELSEEQIAETEILQEDHRAAAEPIITQQGELRQLMKELLEADPQDATAIGQVVIDLESGRDALKAEWESFIAAFEALLTEVQAEDWEDYQTLRRLSRRSPHGPQAGDPGNKRFRRPVPPAQN